MAKRTISMMVYGCDGLTSKDRCLEVADWLEEKAKFFRTKKNWPELSSRMKFTLELRKEG
jgi:hypothetical protein